MCNDRHAKVGLHIFFLLTAFTCIHAESLVLNYDLGFSIESLFWRQATKLGSNKTRVQPEGLALTLNILNFHGLTLQTERSKNRYWHLSTIDKGLAFINSETKQGEFYPSELSALYLPYLCSLLFFCGDTPPSLFFFFFFLSFSQWVEFRSWAAWSASHSPNNATCLHLETLSSLSIVDKFIESVTQWHRPFCRHFHL